MDSVAVDDPRVGAIAADGLRLLLDALPDAVAAPLVAIQLASKTAGILSAHPHAVAGLVSRGGEPVAYVILARSAEAVHLCDIAVVSAAQGTGVGRALLAEVLGTADAAGDAVTLSVWHDAPARRWYERHGFVVTGGDPEGHLGMRREPRDGEYSGIHSVA